MNQFVRFVRYRCLVDAWLLTCAMPIRFCSRHPVQFIPSPLTRARSLSAPFRCLWEGVLGSLRYRSPAVSLGQTGPGLVGWPRCGAVLPTPGPSE